MVMLEVLVVETPCLFSHLVKPLLLKSVSLQGFFHMMTGVSSLVFKRTSPEPAPDSVLYETLVFANRPRWVP